MHGVLGVVAVLGLERGARGVPRGQPVLVLVPLLRARAVAALAVEEVDEVMVVADELRARAPPGSDNKAPASTSACRGSTTTRPPGSDVE